MSKYDRLRVFLSDQSDPVLTLSFAQIERILSTTLPSSARAHNAWWANQRAGSHVHSRAWLDAGYRTREVNFNAATITFVRSRPAAPREREDLATDKTQPAASPPDSTIATQFTEAMLRTCDELERLMNYRPTRFLQMVGEHGGVEAAKRLLRGRATSDGFARMWEAGRLSRSVEAHALLPRFAALFTEEERRSARQRLEAHRFDVDRFLDEIGDAVP